MRNFRWWFRVLLVEIAFIAASIWIIAQASDTEAAKPRESLDLQLGYAINFWAVVIGGSLLVASFAVRIGFLQKVKTDHTKIKLRSSNDANGPKADSPCDERSIAMPAARRPHTMDERNVSARGFKPMPEP
jgi:hypothetical protein